MEKLIYQKLTPKVGDKFRVVKDAQFLSRYMGKIVTVESVDSTPMPVRVGCRGESSLWINAQNVTTEYLEPVEEIRGKITHRMLTPEEIQSFYLSEQPIKKTLIQKTMNAFKKALLSADTKTLIKAGYMDEETLALTSKGKTALDFISFEKYKKELVDAAKETIKEEKEDAE